MAAPGSTLDRLFDPISQALTPEVARRIIALRAEPEVQARVDYLAERCNEGVLTDDERAEYEALVSAATFISILQVKARRALANPAA